MKKQLLFLFLSAQINFSYANYLDDWTNEDLCRWLDSISIPEQILDEIDEREIICYVSYEANGLKAQIPSKYENGIVLPLSSSQTIRTVKPNRTIPILLRFNFKFTL